MANLTINVASFCVLFYNDFNFKQTLDPLKGIFVSKKGSKPLTAHNFSRLNNIFCFSQGHQIGFVEICLGDLPLNKEIVGWFELRHPDALRRTSGERYATHCQRREDQLHRWEGAMWDECVV